MAWPRGAADRARAERSGSRGRHRLASRNGAGDIGSALRSQVLCRRSRGFGRFSPAVRVVARSRVSAASSAVSRGPADRDHDGVNPEADDLLLRARYLSVRTTDEDNKRAIDLLEQAIALEPGFCRGVRGAGLCLRHSPCLCHAGREPGTGTEGLLPWRTRRCRSIPMLPKDT